MPQSEIVTWLLYLSPILIIQIGLAIYALVDLRRRQSTRGPRWLWAVLLALSTESFPGGVIISGIYLSWARNVEA